MQENNLNKATVTLEVTYQPLNGTYGCKSILGNSHFFTVNEDLNDCIIEAVRHYIK